MEIYPKVHCIHQMFVNLYLVVGDDEMLLIDTGIKGSRRLILGAIRQAGGQAAGLKTILITHADGDHFGGLCDLQKVSKATAYASASEAQAIRSGRSSRSLHPLGLGKLFYGLVAPLFKSQPARIDALVTPGQEFNFLGGLQAIATPGHTPGHISFFSPSTGILFAGDSIVIGNRKLRPSGEGNTWDPVEAGESFERQMALKPSLILAGHGTWKRRAAS